MGWPWLAAHLGEGNSDDKKPLAEEVNSIMSHKGEHASNKHLVCALNP